MSHQHEISDYLASDLHDYVKAYALLKRAAADLEAQAQQIETLQGLSAGWRAGIKQIVKGAKESPSHDLRRMINERAEAFTICADELDAALGVIRQSANQEETKELLTRVGGQTS